MIAVDDQHEREAPGCVRVPDAPVERQRVGTEAPERLARASGHAGPARQQPRAVDRARAQRRTGGELGPVTIGARAVGQAAHGESPGRRGIRQAQRVGARLRRRERGSASVGRAVPGQQRRAPDQRAQAGGQGEHERHPAERRPRGKAAGSQRGDRTTGQRGRSDHEQHDEQLSARRQPHPRHQVEQWQRGHHRPDHVPGHDAHAHDACDQGGDRARDGRGHQQASADQERSKHGRGRDEVGDEPDPQADGDDDHADRRAAPGLRRRGDPRPRAPQPPDAASTAPVARPPSRHAGTLGHEPRQQRGVVKARERKRTRS